MDDRTIDQANPWKVLEQRVSFDCPYYQARQDRVRFSGRDARIYNSIRMKHHGVCVAPVDRDGCITLVGQYRYVLDRYTWELPGGGLPSGMDPEVVARSELAEEAGLKPRHLLKIVEGAASPGSSDEVVHGYVAWDLEDGTPNPDPEERISLRKVPFDEAVDLALRGEISHLVGSALLLGLQARLLRRQLPDRLASLLQREG